MEEPKRSCREVVTIINMIFASLLVSGMQHRRSVKNVAVIYIIEQTTSSFLLFARTKEAPLHDLSFEICAVIPVRTNDITILLFAKTKVTPQKKLSFPRLNFELQSTSFS